MDPSELRTHLQRNHQQSYGWALCCCNHDPHQAEDVLQTAYLKILEGKARFDGKSAFKTWLFSVIRKTAADERRRTFLRRLRFIDSEDENASDAETTDETIARSELQSIFHRALDALPRRQREVLQLVFYNDFTLKEAAGVMMISIGSARTHYDRGKKRIRQWMEEIDERGLARKKHQGILPTPEAGR